MTVSDVYTTSRRIGNGAKWRRLWPALSPAAIGYLFVLPLVLWLMVVLIYPMINLFYLSLTNTRIVGAPSAFIGFGNYMVVLSSADFWSAAWKSLVWLVGNMIVATVVAFSAALLIRLDWRPARQARIWILLPWVIPTVAVAVIWQWMFNANYGILNYILIGLGLIAEPLNIFGTREFAMIGVIIANTWHWFPLTAIVMFGAMQNIPGELYEAAKLDGANAFQQFLYITLPSIAKVMFALGLVGSLWTLNVFDTIYLTTRGGPSGSTLTLPVHIYDTAFKGMRIGRAAAMAAVSIVLLGIFAAAFTKLMAPKKD